MTDLENDLIEELRVAHTNETLLVADAVVLLQSRSQAFGEIARLRQQVTAVTRERDAARSALRKVCAGAGFKVPEGTPS